VLPFEPLSRKGFKQRVLVPLLGGEAVWVAISLRPVMSLVASGPVGSRVRIRGMAETSQEKLLAVDALLVAGEPKPFTATELTVATTPPAAEQDHLTLQIYAEDAEGVGYLGVVFGTPNLYQLISGLPAPGATTANDAYGGWRLP
jgi:hypothetical protein